MLKQILLMAAALLGVLVLLVFLWLNWFNSQARHSAERSSAPFGIFLWRTASDGRRVLRHDLQENTDFPAGQAQAGIEILLEEHQADAASGLRLGMTGLAADQLPAELVLRLNSGQAEESELRVRLAADALSAAGEMQVLLHDGSGSAARLSRAQLEKLAAAHELELHCESASGSFELACVPLVFSLSSGKYLSMLRNADGE